MLSNFKSSGTSGFTELLASLRPFGNTSDANRLQNPTKSSDGLKFEESSSTTTNSNKSFFGKPRAPRASGRTKVSERTSELRSESRQVVQESSFIERSSVRHFTSSTSVAESSSAEISRRSGRWERPIEEKLERKVEKTGRKLGKTSQTNRPIEALDYSGFHQKEDELCTEMSPDAKPNVSCCRIVVHWSHSETRELTSSSSRYQKNVRA